MPPDRLAGARSRRRATCSSIRATFRRRRPTSSNRSTGSKSSRPPACRTKSSNSLATSSGGSSTSDAHRPRAGRRRRRVSQFARRRAARPRRVRRIRHPLFARSRPAAGRDRRRADAARSAAARRRGLAVSPRGVGRHQQSAHRGRSPHRGPPPSGSSAICKSPRAATRCSNRVEHLAGELAVGERDVPTRLTHRDRQIASRRQPPCPSSDSSPPPSTSCPPTQRPPTGSPRSPTSASDSAFAALRTARSSDTSRQSRENRLAWQTIVEHFASLERLADWLGEPRRNSRAATCSTCWSTSPRHESLPRALRRCRPRARPLGRHGPHRRSQARVPGRHVGAGVPVARARGPTLFRGRLPLLRQRRPTRRGPPPSCPPSERSQEEMLLFYEVAHPRRANGSRSATRRSTTKPKSLPPSPYVTEVERAVGPATSHASSRHRGPSPLPPDGIAARPGRLAHPSGARALANRTRACSPALLALLTEADVSASPIRIDAALRIDRRAQPSRRVRPGRRTARE